jgi:hypothetical protein
MKRKEALKRLRRALSMPEPQQTIALREVFDDLNRPAIETKIRSSLKPRVWQEKVQQLADLHREQLERQVTEAIDPIVRAELNHIFKTWQREARQTGDLLLCIGRVRFDVDGALEAWKP